MGERKVLNKYYPVDFDPAKLPRARRDKDAQMKVRTMLPMSIRCKICGNYMYKGTKFNSRKEVAKGERYIDSIQLFRFYFKCTRCSAEVTIKTDPENSDYVVESGATRNFEPWRAKHEEEDTARKKRKAEEMGNAMKSLENRTVNSKRHMDNLAALEEIKSLKSRHATVSLHETLLALQCSSADEEKKKRELEEAEDEALTKSVVFHKSNDFVKRIEDDDEAILTLTSKKKKNSWDSIIRNKASAVAGYRGNFETGLAIIKVVKKPSSTPVCKQAEDKENGNEKNVLHSLSLLGYGSDDDDEE